MNPWKEAASLLLTTPGQSVVKKNYNQDQDLTLLMTKRSNRSTYLATAYVFPGGHVDIYDLSPDWWSVFENAGISKEDVLSVTKRVPNGHRPPIILNSEMYQLASRQLDPSNNTSNTNTNTNTNSDLSTLVPTDVGLRITAIRETFEETGILLVTSGDALKSSSSTSSTLSKLSTELCPTSIVPSSVKSETNTNLDLDMWQTKVQTNAKNFVDFCLQLKVCPNIWALHEWWNWLTPPSIGHKRFDTMFYTCCLDERPQTHIDNKEVSQIKWYTPVDMLHEHTEKRAFLAPPQVYELSRLLSFESYSDFKRFSVERESQGIERWSPSVSGFKDGLLLSFPGDDVTTNQVSTEANMYTKEMPTLEENRLSCSHLNRIELRVPTCTVYCNLTLPFGHRSPLTYPPSKSVLQSSL